MIYTHFMKILATCIKKHTQIDRFPKKRTRAGLFGYAFLNKYVYVI